jgi:hypothetical protein
VQRCGGGDPAKRGLWYALMPRSRKDEKLSDRRCLMSVANVEVGKSVQKTPRRVSIRRDGEDFVIVSLAEDLVVYRNDDASALRKLCHSLRWEIAVDSSLRG